MLVGANIRPVGDEALTGTDAVLCKKSPVTNRNKDKLLGTCAVSFPTESCAIPHTVFIFQ